MNAVKGKSAATLRELADKYETAEFLENDPSRFMHEVEGDSNREAVAFTASCLSFGARPQFLPKIASIISLAGGDVAGWIAEGRHASDFAKDDAECFYRFYARGDMRGFFDEYRRVMRESGSLGGRLREIANGGRMTGLEAVDAISRTFQSPLVPSSKQSCRKRICMFLRWMVRGGSPVDLGLWEDFIDRRTLVMPLDTHVLSQSVKFGLAEGKCASMAAAVRLTRKAAEIFPDDPLKADFALFGTGVEAVGPLPR